MAKRRANDVVEIYQRDIDVGYRYFPYTGPRQTWDPAEVISWIGTGQTPLISADGEFGGAQNYEFQTSLLKRSVLGRIFQEDVTVERLKQYLELSGFPPYVRSYNVPTGTYPWPAGAIKDEKNIKRSLLWLFFFMTKYIVTNQDLYERDAYEWLRENPFPYRLKITLSDQHDDQNWMSGTVRVKNVLKLDEARTLQDRAINARNNAGFKIPWSRYPLLKQNAEEYPFGKSINIIWVDRGMMPWLELDASPKYVSRTSGYEEGISYYERSGFICTLSKPDFPYPIVSLKTYARYTGSGTQDAGIYSPISLSILPDDTSFQLEVPYDARIKARMICKWRGVEYFVQSVAPAANFRTMTITLSVGKVRDFAILDYPSLGMINIPTSS